MRRAILVSAIAAIALAGGCSPFLIGKRVPPPRETRQEPATPAPEGEQEQNAARTPKPFTRPLIVVFCRDAADPMTQFLEMHFTEAEGWEQFEFTGEQLVVRNNGDYVKLVSGRGLIKYGEAAVAVDGSEVAVNGRFLPPGTRLIAVRKDGTLTTVEQPEPRFPGGIN
jgi:uncharacterized Zn-binding protein involved in type VI secretion